MLNIDTLKFDEKGLIPAIVVDAITKQVLTLAYMNKESLQISIEKELTCFYSRSRQELWLKGETSGNYQHIVSITADCDGDALVVMVEPDGPACHLGTTSCFKNPVFRSEERKEFSYQALFELIRGRKEEKKEGSYTTYLFEKGLIPAIVVDAETKQVLTLAYMNRESLEISMEKGLTCFWSRSRQALWMKGETSGNYQHIVSITADCDCDAPTVLVRKDGPACHTGADSCFNELVYRSDEPEPFTYDGLMELIAGRKNNPQEGSYTTYLVEKGVDKILKKVGEECTEVIIAAKADDRKETVYEIADLAYHVMVLMTEMGISLDEIKSELASRHVIDHKVKQEKMT